MTGLQPDRPGGRATDPRSRIGGDLPQLLTHVAETFALGNVRDWSVLTTGYEDCNVEVRTEQARVVVKVFAADRAVGIAARTAELIVRAQAHGVRHPRLYHDQHGHLVHRHPSGPQVLVMDFVPGHTFYDLDRAPTDHELAGIIAQTVRIHRVDATPPFVFDPWAITNLLPLAHDVEAILDTEQRRLVGWAVDQVEDIDRAILSAVLIHGDLSKGNVLIGENGQITVLDFAVANRFPRVQELAVIAANLTHGSPQPLPQRSETLAELYSAAAPIPLDHGERVALRAFTVAAAAMELIGALAEWHLHGNHSTETAYLIHLGLAGLRDYPPVS